MQEGAEMSSSLKIWSVLVGIVSAVALGVAPAMAHGHGKRSAKCIFQMEKVDVQIDDLGDGVLVTMTSDDEEVIARLRERAWDRVEAEDGAREHDCFFHMAGVQVTLKEAHDGVILTITSDNEKTITELQEMARRATKKGCRHYSHHESHH
jgi:hypothetical protein